MNGGKGSGGEQEREREHEAHEPLLQSLKVATAQLPRVLPKLAQQLQIRQVVPLMLKLRLRVINRALPLRRVPRPVLARRRHVVPLLIHALPRRHSLFYPCHLLPQQGRARELKVRHRRAVAQVIGRRECRHFLVMVCGGGMWERGD